LPGKFVVKKGSTGKFRFSLLSTNGQIVATSESYNSKAAAMGGIRSIQKLAADAAVEDQTTTAFAKQQEEAKAATTARKAAARTRKAAAKKSAPRKATTAAKKR
jgi:uncharacterized protein YegP (UPF0339 family)